MWWVIFSQIVPETESWQVSADFPRSRSWDENMVYNFWIGTFKGIEQLKKLIMLDYM